MGRLSLEKQFPEHFGNPDDSIPISRLRLPATAEVMRTGYAGDSGRTLTFEGETTVSVNFCERAWSYREPNNGAERTAYRWRLEFGVAATETEPLKPGHEMVIAREPYANNWLVRPRFKQYSKKTMSERMLPQVPSQATDAVSWLEENLLHDPWEQRSRIVAGISQPRGFYSEKPRNKSGDMILGVCPDFNLLVENLSASKEVRGLLRDTEEHRLVFWYAQKVQNPPRLYDEVICDCQAEMHSAIQQALAGPPDNQESWIAEPVWKLVHWIYLDHLNRRNKAVHRRRQRELGARPTDL